MKDETLNGGAPDNREYEYRGSIFNGFAMLCLVFIAMPVCIALSIWYAAAVCKWLGVVLAGVFAVTMFVMMAGFFIQEPNEARVMIFFGKYKGTCRQVGYRWVNPFMNRKKLSLRIRNMDIDPIKVNDKVGNPVLIGMVLVWRIKDTYKVVFDLDAQSLQINGSALNNAALNNFVRIQSDAALREVTGRFAYDPESADSDELTLRDGGEQINELLEHKINERLAMAGIEVVEARLNYLAYAPEIAAVMLRRQQASAIITAREKIVEGAVSMVEMALNRLDKNGTVELTEERKAAMVSNLLVVLCADEPVTPMVNTSSEK